jgi:phosphoglycolate phosphatase-like HAD superfamily hydrolase
MTVKMLPPQTFAAQAGTFGHVARWVGRVVGFDLDMTLVDTSAAMALALREVNRQLGTRVDVDSCLRGLGASLREPLAEWVAPDVMEDAMLLVARTFMLEGLRLVRVLPGAATLLAALRDSGGSAVVVTTRRTSTALACLRRCALPYTTLVGGVGPGGKAAVLREHGVDCYVGDHPLDMAAAIDAAVPGIGVTSGFHDAGTLTLAGASVVLDGLLEFPQQADGIDDLSSRR